MIVFYRLTIALTMLGVIAGSGGFWAGRAVAAPGPQPGVTPIPGGLVLEWRAPHHHFNVLPGGTAQVLMPGFSLVSEPGAPQVPFTAALVALPPGAEPTIELNPVEARAMPLPAPLALAPQPQGVHRTAEGQAIAAAFAPATHPTPFDPAPVVLERLGSLRGVQLARVVYYPAIPAGDQLQLVTQVRATVHFNAPGGELLDGDEHPDPLLSVLNSTVANPHQIIPGLRAELDHRPAQAAGVVSGAPMVAIEVAETGLVAISFAGLADSGYPVGQVDPKRVRLSRAGQEIPFEWEGDADDQFESGERLLFYAEPRFSRWTANDVYFLWEADSPQPVMSSRPASPAGLPQGTVWREETAEVNAIYTPDCFCAPIPPGRDGDRWVWDNLHYPARPSGSYQIELVDVDPNRPAWLDLWLIGYTDVPSSPDHLAQVALNGQHLGEIEWDGKQAVAASLPIPASAVELGSNTLSLALPGLTDVSVEGVWLDAFSIRYPRGDQPSGQAVLFSGESTPHAYQLHLSASDGLRAYQVTDPDRPLRLTGLQVSAEGTTLTVGDPDSGGAQRYLVISEQVISAPAAYRLVTPLQTGPGFGGADYLVITPVEFRPALEPLVALRHAQGLQVVVEDLHAIYAAYGDGRPEPEAIRNYLAYAYHNWDPQPLYVLLVGDGTADPKQYVPRSTATFIPPYLADVDPWAGETAADNRYVTLSGEGNLPQMLIGRLPVNSLAEAETVLAKIVQYENNPAPGGWSSAALVVADDTDGGGDFPALSDEIVSDFISMTMTPRRLYYQPAEVAAGEFRQSLLGSWNSGAGLVMYTGHASIHQWAVEKFLHLDDVSDLNNGARLPVVVALTCFTASFHLPGLPALDEALLRHPSGGAVAVWGPTGLGISTGHAALAEGFSQSLLGQNTDLGTAALAGKLNLALKNPAQGDLIDTFTLLGDPATGFNPLPWSYMLYLPQIIK